MQQGEKVDIPDAQEPEREEDNTLHINLRISLFYDGTKNNRENVQSRQSPDKEKNAPYQATRSKKYLLWGALDDGDVSYTNDESNISFLESYVVTKEEGNDLHLTVYTEGAGTNNLGSDKNLGAGLGAAGTGIPAKVKRGIAAAISKIKNADGKITPATTIIDKLTIDVFGFSRGAATARYCIHLLLKDEKMRIKEGKNSLGYKEITKVEVRLAGLFDTVASFREGLFIGNETWLLNLNAVQYAQKVLHLASADEHRKNFSLTNIKSKGGDQYFLPGVHSDIGGGYADGENESLIIFKGTPKEAALDRQRLIDAGWYLEGQITQKDFTPPPDPMVRGYNASPTYSELTVTRSSIPTAYCIIPLKIMAKFVTDDGFILNDRYQEKIAKIDQIAFLKQLEGEINSKLTSATTPEFWINNNTQLLKDARNQFFHFSAHYNSIGMGPRFDDGKRKRKQYDG